MRTSCILTLLVQWALCAGSTQLDYDRTNDKLNLFVKHRRLGRIQCVHDVLQNQPTFHDNVLLIANDVNRSQSIFAKLITFLNEQLQVAIVMRNISELHRLEAKKAWNVIWLTDVDSTMSATSTDIISIVANQLLVIFEQSLPGDRIAIMSKLKFTNFDRVQVIILDGCHQRLCTCTCTDLRKTSEGCYAKLSFSERSECRMNVAVHRYEPYTIVAADGELIGGVDFLLLSALADKLHVGMVYSTKDGSITDR